jgi:hypothetical protein
VELLPLGQQHVLQLMNSRSHEASCRAAQRRFGQLPPEQARLAFASEVQGFVASEVARGTPLGTVIGKVAELLAMVLKANE